MRPLAESQNTETTQLTLNRLIPGLALLLACTAQAQETKCPSYHGKNPLSTVSVFDGPAEEKADLVPDVSKASGGRLVSASWQVGYLYGIGRKVFLVCRFAGLGDADAATIKVDQKVQTCIFRAHGGGQPAEMTCK